MPAKRSLLFFLGFGFSVPSTAAIAALAQRTFVASNGSDAGPCSITAPCRGFAAAVAKTNIGGEVIVQDSGPQSAMPTTRVLRLADGAASSAAAR